MNIALKVLQQLQGRWQFSRVITGVPAHANGRGAAEFIPMQEPSHLRYTERGNLALASGQQTNIHRDYVYQVAHDQLMVFFANQQLFQAITLEPSASVSKLSVGRARHDCQSDVYRTTYFFHPLVVSIKHQVTGPKKDYTILTEYRRP